MRIAAIGLLAFVMAIGPGAVEAKSPAPTVRILSFSERIGKKDTSATDIIAGVTAGPTLATVQDPTLYVYGLQSTDRTLCVNIRHVNGAYAAEMTASIIGAGGTGPLALPFRDRTQHPGSIRGRRAVELAVSVRASRTSTCGPDAPFAPVSWRRAAAEPLTLLILTRGDSAEVDGAPGAQGVPCSSLALIPGLAGSMTTYDAACTIAALRCSKTTLLEVRREDANGNRRPAIIPVRASC